MQSADPPARPDDGHSQTLVWTLDGDGTVTGSWVRGAVFSPEPRTAAEIAAEHDPIETIADMEAFRLALEGSM